MESKLPSISYFQLLRKQIVVANPFPRFQRNNLKEIGKPLIAIGKMFQVLYCGECFALLEGTGDNQALAQEAMAAEAQFEDDNDLNKALLASMLEAVAAFGEALSRTAMDINQPY